MKKIIEVKDAESEKCCFYFGCSCSAHETQQENCRENDLYYEEVEE